MKILAICGGNGTWLQPFGSDLVANIEPRGVYKTPDDIQWKLNFPDTPLYKTLPLLEGIDIIVGAPDCGHSSVFSLSRAKQFHDPKENDSLTLFFKGVKYYKPKVFVMENLPKALETLTLDDIRQILPDYQVYSKNFGCDEIGNSQITRKRCIIYGRLSAEWLFRGRKTTLNYPCPTFHPFPVTALKKVNDLLRDLPEDGQNRENIDSVISLYGGKKLSLREIQFEWAKRTSERWYIEGENKMNTAPGVYRLFPFRYPMTVRKTNRQFNPQGLMMSPRELARIQGIPDSFKIWYDKSRPEYSINKGRVTVAKTPPYEFGVWLNQTFKTFYYE